MCGQQWVSKQIDKDEISDQRIRKARLSCTLPIDIARIQKLDIACRGSKDPNEP